ncbi:MAG: hypothetical protein KF777_14510 [Planctomycetaceae bacterium]|nr:hypothetical protein [Planctomycetaceae bacterium]
MPVTEYTWDPVTDSILEETDGAENVLVSYTNEPASYGPLISLHSGSETHYFHFDALGSTRELTDDSDDVMATFAYDAWGNEVQQSGTSQTEFRWSGRWGYALSSPNHTLYIRARIYTPFTGRFCSLDPVGFHSGDNNLYRYSLNSPALLTDPSGHGAGAMTYLCFFGIGACAGSCFCTDPLAPSVLIQVAMMQLEEPCCLSSCCVGNVFWAGQPIAMMACLQQVLRTLFSPLTTCTCT